MVQSFVWAGFIVLGWIVFAYLAFLAPGGLEAAWTWVRSLNIILQLLLWLAFLPWMIALWLWQLSWPLWLRVLLILGLVFVTYSMSVPPLLKELSGSG